MLGSTQEDNQSELLYRASDEQIKKLQKTHDVLNGGEWGVAAILFCAVEWRE